MAAQVRVLRERVRSVRSTQKITRAQETIATSRIAKAQAKVAAAAPYSRQITEALTALAGASSLTHPLLTERTKPRRAGILLITSDRGLCGGYNVGVIKAAEELGALLRRANRRKEARDLLREGLDIAHHAGARPVADRAATELRATGAKPRRAPLTGVESLTASERRVAELAAQGLTNREIAQALFVTARTVEGHLTRTFQKLDLRSREDLAGALVS